MLSSRRSNKTKLKEFTDYCRLHRHLPHRGTILTNCLRGGKVGGNLLFHVKSFALCLIQYLVLLTGIVWGHRCHLQNARRLKMTVWREIFSFVWPKFTYGSNCYGVLQKDPVVLKGVLFTSFGKVSRLVSNKGAQLTSTRAFWRTV